MKYFSFHCKNKKTRRKSIDLKFQNSLEPQLDSLVEALKRTFIVSVLIASQRAVIMF